MAKNEDTDLTFSDMELDARLLKALNTLGWVNPTPIQKEAIPRALEGKDILARARTGSGKTGAFVIPLVQTILRSLESEREQEIRGLVLLPSKELSAQVLRCIQEVCMHCIRVVNTVDISTDEVPFDALSIFLKQKPDIVVGTPSKVLRHLKAGDLSLKSLLMVVVDEADLIFSFGGESDVKELKRYLPPIYQGFLTSATLGEDVASLRKLVLHNVVKLDLQESSLPPTSQLTQYSIHCEEEDKFVLLMCLYKLKLLQGRSIVFVNNVERCYRVKLFLDQFGISACVLNSELPANIRNEIVLQYNDGRYDIIIASDEARAVAQKQTTSKQRGSGRRDRNYSMARGMDFQRVSIVVNFDFPRDANDYIHRVGRTARATLSGTALSFISVGEVPRMEEVVEDLSTSFGQDNFSLQPFNFKMSEIDGFRYRAKDVLRAITPKVLREIRLREINTAIMGSEKLKTFFKDNPRDLQVLKNERETGQSLHLPQHLGNIPDYNIPSTLRQFYKNNVSQQTLNARKGFAKRGGRKKKNDPLRSFTYSGIGKGKSKRK